MFTHLFEERDKKITQLVKLGDCIGRSLRENVMLFSIDGDNHQVTYLTESRKVISGDYSLDGDVSITNITVEDASVFEDGTRFDEFVSKKIESFVESVHYGEYASADSSFSDVLSLWENRLKLGGIQQRLSEQSNRLSSVEKIIESEEFQQVLEVTPQLISFLSENMEKITKVPEVRNAVNLSNSVSQAFDFPRLTLEEIEENGEYVLVDGVNESIYEMVCRQELVKRELLESKREFDVVWASNPTISTLASCIFENEETTVMALAEAIREVPYICLASKRSLFNTFSNCLSQVDGATAVNEREIQAFASKIFEYKKDAREVFVKQINEKYGVNVQNLTDPASFRSLANTQVVIFEALSRLAPKATVLKSVLSEMATSLKGKHGVECIDINEYLLETFVQAGYDKLISEGEKEKKIDFKRVSQEINDIQDLVLSLKEKLATKDSMNPEDEATDDMKDDHDDGSKKAPASSEEIGVEEAVDSKKGEEKAAQKPESEASGEEDLVSQVASAVSAEQRAEEEKAAQEEDPANESGVEELQAEMGDKTTDDMVDELSDLEAIVADLASQFDDEDKD